MTMIMATGIYNHEKSIWPTVSTLYIDFMYKQLHAYSLHPQNLKQMDIEDEDGRRGEKGY